MGLGWFLTWSHFSFVGSLVISAYAVCPDITATVTPDLKHPGGKGMAPSPLSLCICSELIPCLRSTL